MLTECRRGRYLSALQPYLFFQYVNVRTSAVQFVRVAVRGTCCTAEGIVRVRTLGTVVGTVGTVVGTAGTYMQQ